jgi:polyisoprenyl-phosphate glycosyltransferase
MKTLSFVIPVYRNEKTVSLAYENVKGLFSKELSSYQYEFVFINDGSDDNSLSALLQLRETDKQVRIISFARNFGQTPALIAGYREAKGDAVINLAADLQEPVELIIQMVAEWEKGDDIVICYRQQRNDGFVRNMTSRFFYRLIKLSNPRMPSGGFDFMLMDRKAVNEFNRLNERNRFFQGDVLWLGFGIKFIPYERLQRTIGKSQWTLSKRMKYFIDGILNTAYWPIRMMSFLGILFAFIGFVYALVVVYARIVNATPFKGYAPIVILILIIGGLVMLMLGIIGEYIWRIYDEAKKRPQYIIKEKYE